ncbi:MAG TPA: FAD-dependent oxidoreductase [Capillimicrobium sp.]|nr:FAD-dependent oxidoreductase [Capillimicrobium sp.]
MDVVIAGGGVAAVEAALALRDLAGDRVAVTLVSPRPDFVLTPLAVAEPFAAGHAERRPLRSLAEEAGFAVIAAGVTRVRPEEQVVELSDGSERRYDALLLAPGARPVAAYGHVHTFMAEDEPSALSGLVADLEEGWSKSVAFVVPPGVTWPLPAYELALLTAAEVRSMGLDGVTITLVTPEERPLGLFGDEASAAVAGLLESAGIEFVGGVEARGGERGVIRLMPGDRPLEAERVVALPVLEGRRLAGIPRDEQGFIPIDEYGRVQGLRNVYAAGDATTFPIKQGGIATQQADAVAEQIAASAGAPITPRPFRPVLRGQLLTGAVEQYMRAGAEVDRGRDRASIEPLWWPPTKIAGRYLGPWLAQRQPRSADAPAGRTIDVEVLLD